MSNQTSETLVLIVGAGPVGLSLAVELGMHGVDCLVIEREAQHYVAFPTTNNLSIRLMEHFRRWGIADRVREGVANLPYSRIWLTSVGGRVLARQDYPTNGEAVPLPYSPETFCWSPKPYFDPILIDRARSFSGTNIRFGCRFDSYEQDEDGVSVEVTDTVSGRKEIIRASYVVGCDGASSEVRRRAGFERQGLFADRSSVRGLNVYFRAPALAERLPMIAAHVYLMNPKLSRRPGGFPILVAIDGVEKWRAGVPPESAGSQAEIEEHLRRLCGGDIEIELINTSRGSVANRAVNRQYRDRRVFVAGDSAHLNTPVGGLGANTGMMDAIDLGWKLAAVLDGWGGDSLLNSYESERRPVAMQLIRYQGVDLISGEPVAVESHGQRPMHIPENIEDDTPEAESERRRVGLELYHMHHGHQDHPGLEMFHYDQSPICVADGTPPPPAELTTYTQTARPGSRAPHIWLRKGCSTLDLVGPGFTLLRFGGESLVTARLETAAAARGVPLRVADIYSQEAWTLYERRLALVRPDGHVAWRADEEPEDAFAVIDCVRGASRSEG